MSGNVAVAKVPEHLGAAQSRGFLRDTVGSVMDSHRPRLVLDCSDLRVLNEHAIHALLGCLEEAMKRNGDVKLASVSPEASAALERTRLSELFEIYDTAEEAVKDFHPSVYKTGVSATLEESL